MGFGHLGVFSLSFWFGRLGGFGTGCERRSDRSVLGAVAKALESGDFVTLTGIWFPSSRVNKQGGRGVSGN